MKLGKEEIQKVALTALLLVGLLYVYFTYLLKPLREKEATANQQIEELQPQIRAANAQLRQVEELEAQAPAAADTFAQVVSLIPEGSPIAWFPPRMVEFFHRQGIAKTSVRLVREGAAPGDLKGFRQLSWIIELRDVEFVPLGIAIAALESEEPLLQIDQLQIEDAEANIEKQHAILNVSNIVKQ